MPYIKRAHGAHDRSSPSRVYDESQQAAEHVLCRMRPPNFCILVCVARDIKRGEELFVNYGADDAILEKKWGVPLR